MGSAADQQRHAEEILREFLRQGGLGGFAGFGGDGFGGGGGGIFGDMFEQNQHGPQRGGDIEVLRRGRAERRPRCLLPDPFCVAVQTSLNIGFMDAVKGVERTINVNSLGSCNTCSGSGEKPGTKSTKCTTCRGSGMVGRD